MRSLFLLSVIICFADAEFKPRKGSGPLCTFKDKTYSPGDGWHPHLEPFGLLLCVRCVCTEKGHVKCNTVKCPALSCAHPVAEPRRCCPKCTGDPVRIPAGLRASVKSCSYNGTIYQPGETFSKRDLFPAKQRNQCAMCTCANGNIFCALKTCQPVTCSSPVALPDSCCLVCKDRGAGGFSSADDAKLQLHRGVRHSVDQCPADQNRARPDRLPPTKVRTSARGLSLSKLNLKGASETTVKIVLQRKHQRACFYNGRTYSHGDLWHPVLGKVLECILCTCTDGRQDCKRITCPAQYPCQYPVKAAGKCCKTCPEGAAEANHTTQCYPGNPDSLLVYKVESSFRVDPPSRLRVIAVERPGIAEVELQVWKWLEGVLQLMEIGDVQKKDMVDHPENYTLLTTLDQGAWRQFKEEGGRLDKASQALICQDGIREMVTFLSPRQTEGICSP